MQTEPFGRRFTGNRRLRNLARLTSFAKLPLAVIRTPYVERIGTKAGPIARWLLRGRKTKHWMRMIYALRSAWQLKRASLKGGARESTSAKSPT